MKTRATFKTESASRHLTALCRHFGHKVQTRCRPAEGCVQFSFGKCEMTADPHALKLVATAEDEEQLDRVVQIITNHLERFAFRENPRLVWQAKAL